MKTEQYDNLTYDEKCRQYRYKIYARKSTEDDGRQIRSINDQIEDCQALAGRLGLKVIGEPVKETRSAMESNRRPHFKALLKEIKEEKIDGIIAWHPDRLARNAIESGKVIDMLDKGEIKDLRFHSYQFDNSPNGKMMLGMLFVFAKHYSDDLSQKVQRGVRKRLKEGFSGGLPKHGYIQHGGVYTPDHHGSDNFKLLQNAWNMRAQGVKLNDISEYLTSHGYTKHYHPEKNGSREDEWRLLKIDDSVLSRVFNDTFYFGVLAQSNQTVDLRSKELGLNFEPMITEEIYLQVQDNNKSSKRGKNKKTQLFMPCRDIIFCDACHDKRPLIVSRSLGSRGRYYLYFRCRNKDCPRRKHDIRGKEIMGAIEATIEHVISVLSDDTYETYLRETKSLTATAQQHIRSDIAAIKARINSLHARNDNLKAQLPLLTDQRALDDTNCQIADTLNTIDKLETEVGRNERRLMVSSAKTKKYTEQEFKTLIKNTTKLFKKGNLFQKERIIREIFLNFSYGQEKMASFSLREPFATLYKTKETTSLASGGG